VFLLLVAADARAAGMADGITTSADAFLNNGIQPNMLLLLMQGFSISYTLLTDLVNDISLGQVTYYQIE
jgi:hypothetical protein